MKKVVVNDKNQDGVCQVRNDFSIDEIDINDIIALKKLFFSLMIFLLILIRYFFEVQRMLMWPFPCLMVDYILLEVINEF